MSYVVLARKWRPKTFADLTGQGHVAQTLTNAIERGRVPHALLFTGSRGVGKTSSARILAMALNCKSTDGPTTTPCGTCPACTEIQAGQSVDVLEIDGASNRGINEIRELRDGVRYAPNRDRYKVYIIDEVHMLTTEAFNALLKTLEEPPQHVVFIFATTEAHKIPVTILSRCQRFDFRRIGHTEMVGRLEHIVSEEGLTIAPEVLAQIARQAAGGMRDSLSLLDQVIAFAGDNVDTKAAAEILGAAERRQLFALTAAMIDRDVDAALSILDEVESFGINLAHFANDLVSLVRDLAVVASASDASALTPLTDGELAEARAQVARADTRWLYRIFEVLVDAAESVARSPHARLLFEMALIRIVTLEPLISIDHLITRLEALAGGEVLPDGPDTPSGGSAPGSASTPDVAPSSEIQAQNTSSSDAQPIKTAAAPEPTEAAAAPEPTEAAAAPEPTEIAAAPEPTETAAAPEPTETAAAPEPTETAAAPEPTETAAAPEPTETAAAPEPTETAAAPEPTETAAAPEPTETAAAPEPDAEPAQIALTAEPDASQSLDASSGATDQSSTEMPEAPQRTRGEVTPVRIAVDAEMSNEAWREVVEVATDRDPRLGAALHSAYLLSGSATETVFAFDPHLHGRWTDPELELLSDAVLVVTGRRFALRPVASEEASKEDLGAAFVVRKEIEAERAAYVAQVETFVHNHPATRRIMEAWPTARLRVEVAAIPREGRQ